MKLIKQLFCNHHFKVVSKIILKDDWDNVYKYFMSKCIHCDKIKKLEIK
jgi:hypothetical protein